MPNLAILFLAALAEIAGCFAVWMWWRKAAGLVWLVPGVASLILFAWLLSLVPSEAAGRTFAAYGGIYIACAVLWMWLAEGQMPDRWDLIGAAICLSGTAVILIAHRPA